MGVAKRRPSNGFTKLELSYLGGVYRDNWKTVIKNLYIYFTKNRLEFQFM